MTTDEKPDNGLSASNAGLADYVRVHTLKAIDENCDHDWRDGHDGNPEQCTKCGLSFIRYIHCCFP